ncbi:MAG: RadC family protein [Desulfovibrio sp.]|uniref:RadC family protein n=1 Tax=Desulfovibrio sp. 7SRBS1 TaxID=3378064 RepID=UPI003B40AC82
MSTPHYHGHRQRLREKLQRDAKALEDYEILELLLGHVLRRADTKPLAKELLDRFGTLHGVFNAGKGELAQVKGFGPSLDLFWTLWRETWARLHEAPLRKREVINQPRDIADMAMARLGPCRSEEFWVALVDNKNRLVAWECVSTGTVDEAPVYPREVLSKALHFQASGIILVHNHPGGDPKPSSQDIDLTRRLIRSGHDLGVRILDHLIVTDRTYYSFQTEGML